MAAFLEEPKRELKVALAQLGSLARLNPAFIPFVLHMVKIADQAQHEAGGHRGRIQGLVEAATSVRKTPDPDDSGL